MGTAPKDNYISLEKRESVLIWNFSNPLTPMSILFAFGVGVFFAMLMMLQSNDISQTATVGLSIVGTIIAWSFTKRQFLKSDRLRIALVINTKGMGTGSYLWAYNIPWSEVKKIHFNSATAISRPVSHLDLWIYPKAKAHRFISIPKLNSNEYQDFFEVLQWHTKRNNVELILI